MIGKTISHYKILEKIGSGGMGTVYKAQDTKLDRHVALKFLPPHLSQAEEEKKRFIHEAKAASALDHPNICSIYEINETKDGQLFIAMACYEGESLKEKIAKGPLSLEEALDIAGQIAGGLEKAHNKKIVHRDIKPANILITEDGVIKIVDFGLAKLAGQTKLTKTGSTLGTVAYMSPEQAQGTEVDERTDIWAFGAILYEMLAGKPPFTGEYEQAVLYSIMNENPIPLSEVSPDIPETLEHIVSRALEKDPDKRYQHIKELLDDLESLSAGIVPEKIKSRMRKAKLRKQRKAILYSMTAGLLITLVAVLILLTRQAQAIDSIAILPLKNLTGNAEQEYFVDGVTDELIGELGQISGLKRVISRHSIMQYKNTDKSLADIAHELNVDAIVEGTVYQVGDSIRVRLQLIDVLPKEQNLWGETYKRPMREVLVMYSDVARTVASKIHIGLTGEEETRLADTRLVNPEAYDAYLKGMFHWQRLNPEDLEAALLYFESALEKDPNYIPALTGMYRVGAGYGILGVTPSDETASKLIAAQEKVLELEEKPAEVHYLMAVKKTWGEMDWKKAEKSYRKAIELNPNFPEAQAYYSHYLFIMNRPDEAMVQIERAMELDPFNPLFQSLYGVDLVFMRRYDEAIVQFQKALKTVPNHGVAADVLAQAYHQKGMYKEALEQKKRYYESIGLEEVAQSMTRGYEKAGCRQGWIYAAETLEKLSKETLILPIYIAESYSYAGNKEKTMDWLEKGWEMKNDGNMAYIGVDPHFVDLLKNEPRFQELLRKMNLPVGDNN